MQVVDTAQPATDNSTQGATTPAAPTGQPTSQPQTANPSDQAPASTAPLADTGKPEDRFAPKFAALTKREREILKKEQSISEREKQFKEYETKRARAKEDPAAALEALGLTYEEITEHYISGKNPEKVRLRQIERELREAKEAREREQQESQQKQVQKQIDDFKSNLTAEVKQAGEQFELVNHFGAYDLVYNVMDEWYREKGEILPVAKAAEMVEKHCELEIQKYKNLKKMRGMFTPSEPPAAPTESNPTEPANSEAERIVRTNTLTNAQSSTGTDAGSSRLTSREEDLKMAAKLLMS
jgi:hypothetical protein